MVLRINKGIKVMERDLYVIVLAAGKGQRMASRNESYSKVAYPILGKPLVNYVLDAAKPLGAKETFVVVGFGGEETAKCVEGQAKVVWQKEVLGTGHAVMQVSEYLKDKDGEVIILCGDTPLLNTETIQKVLKKHTKNGNKLTICSTVLSDPEGYGRVIREKPSYRVLEVRPYAEINEEEKEIGEINSGIYIVDNKLLQEYLPKLSRENKKDEYYLSDIVGLMFKDGHQVDSYVLEDAQYIFNINDRTQLAYAAKLLRKRINHELMLSGVSIEDPVTAYISPDVKIGKDTVILANVEILGKCEIGPANWIGPNVTLENVTMGENNRIIYSVIRDKDIGDNENIGPYVYIEGKKC